MEETTIEFTTQPVQTSLFIALMNFQTECPTIPKLKKGGRIVIMSYHSLEDRIVKHVFKELASKQDDAIPSIKIITNKPIEATDEEIGRNPRARTAKLRIAEKC